MKPTLTAEQKLRCLHGTFAAEGMQIPSKTRTALHRLDSGKATMEELLRDIVFSKYEVYSTAQSLD